MINSKTDINELSAKVLVGVQRALRKLVEKSAANNESLIIGDKDGNVKSVQAKELLKTLPKKTTYIVKCLANSYRTLVASKNTHLSYTLQLLDRYLMGIFVYTCILI